MDSNQKTIPYVNKEDDTLILVKCNRSDRDETKRYIAATAEATISTLRKHGVVKLRSVGSSAIGNSVKVILRTKKIIRNRTGKENLAIDMRYEDVLFDGRNTTAVTMILKQR